MHSAQVAIALLALVSARAFGQTANTRGGQPLEEAIRAAGQAIEANPRDAAALARRAALYAEASQPQRAIADYDRLLAIEPTADALDARGSEQFKLGRIDQSIADFDAAIERDPKREPWHWKRGISYYYAGRYDEGRQQFEGYQTVDDNDVENAVWRYLCMARAAGVEAARADMLKIKPDPRVGMMAVYALYSGQSAPEDVLAAARAGSPTPEQLNARMFYAHLYLGLYWESLGDAQQARRELAEAVKHKIGHYMWNVADVHAKRLAAGEN